eukprot:gene1516-1674_t
MVDIRNVTKSWNLLHACCFWGKEIGLGEAVKSIVFQRIAATKNDDTFFEELGASILKEIENTEESEEIHKKLKAGGVAAFQASVMFCKQGPAHYADLSEREKTKNGRETESQDEDQQSDEKDDDTDDEIDDVDAEDILIEEFNDRKEADNKDKGNYERKINAIALNT